jgi:hypothetical protein
MNKGKKGKRKLTSSFPAVSDRFFTRLSLSAGGEKP